MMRWMSKEVPSVVPTYGVAMGGNRTEIGAVSAPGVIKEGEETKLVLKLGSYSYMWP